MTTLELEASKTELIRDILCIDRSEVLEYIRAELHKCLSVRTPPCMYTLEEVKERLKQSEAEILAGKGIPHEEVERILDQCI